MSKKIKINSRDYWNDRFKKDWEEKGGKEQTTFFSKIALLSVPKSFWEMVAANKLTVLDWGCAEGQGTEILRKRLKTEVYGLDFSQIAINKARKINPQSKFHCGTLEEWDKKFNIIFSSNCLEHFKNPTKILETYFKYATDYVFLMVPFQEYKNREKEHFSIFDYKKIKMLHNEFFLLYFNVVDAAKYKSSYWGGKQLIVIYANKKAKGLEELDFNLGHLPNAAIEKKLNSSFGTIVQQESFIKELVTKSDDLTAKLELLKKENHRLKEELQGFKEELWAIYCSRTWKLRGKLLKIKCLLCNPFSILLGRILRKSKNAYKEKIYDFIKTRSYVKSLPKNYKVRDNTKLTVVLQLDHFDKGGLEEVVFSLAKKLSKETNLYIFVNDNKLGYLGEKAVQEGAKVILLDNNRYLLRKIIKKLKIDLVNLHYSVFGVEDYYKLNIPMIYTIHNSYIWADDVFVKNRTPSYEKITSFIAVSRQARSFFINRFGVKADKVKTIPNGLDLESVKKITKIKRENFGLKKEDFVFVNVASFNWNKFHILMVEAMKTMIQKYPQFKMIFIGNILDENCYSYVTNKIEDYNLKDNIKIIDYISKEKILGFLKMSNCFILPSLIEGWSIAVMEAMYSELPLILSDIGSARDVIQGEDIGIIIKSPYEDVNKTSPEFLLRFHNNENLNNLDSLCKAMEDLYLNRKRWVVKAKLGKQKIVKDFNSNKMAECYLKLFKKTLEEKNGKK